MTSPALFTSKNQEWETPKSVFDYFNERFNFTLDVCANARNAKVARYFSPEVDGLAQSWRGERVWMNPPYCPSESACKAHCKKKRCELRGHHNDKNIPGQAEWIQKAHYEVFQNGCELAACLVPARTDTRVFHDFILPDGRLWFLRGRVKFVGAKAGAVFPSMVVLFDNYTLDFPMVNSIKI